MSEEVEKQKTRRKGIAQYGENPFVKDALVSTKTGTRRISATNGRKDRFMIVSDHGEIVAPAGFHEIVEVDKSQFVKLYVNGVKAIQGLTSPGTRVFELVFMQVQEKPGKDTVYITFPAINQEITPISRATFDRGMRELLEKKFLAMTRTPGIYYINIDYVFNGNRLAFIKEFRIKGTSQVQNPRVLSEEEAHRQKLEENGQTRIPGTDELIED